MGQLRRSQGARKVHEEGGGGLKRLLGSQRGSQDCGVGVHRRPRAMHRSHRVAGGPMGVPGHIREALGHS